MSLTPLPWLQVRVELEGSAAIACDPPPGRIVIAGPGHTFLQLAETIDDAFARWDRAHLHAFELPDGRFVGLPDAGPPLRDGPRWLDHRAIEVLAALAPGDRFAYTFDLTQGWRHECRVLEETIDPLAVFGERPTRPAIAFGWGSIPDQYGRTGSEEQGAKAQPVLETLLQLLMEPTGRQARRHAAEAIRRSEQRRRRAS